MLRSDGTCYGSIKKKLASRESRRPDLEVGVFTALWALTFPNLRRHHTLSVL